MHERGNAAPGARRESDARGRRALCNAYAEGTNVDEDGDEDGTVEAMRAECKSSAGGDSKAGCVAYVKCEDARSRNMMDALTVAFVDVAMSQCFRVGGHNSRLVEVLEMTRVSEERDVRGHGAGVWYTVRARTIGDTRGFTVHV